MENFMGRGAWHATVHRVAKESDMTEGLMYFISTNWLQEKKIILLSLSTSLYALLFPTTKTTILLLETKHIPLLGEAQ